MSVAGGAHTVLDNAAAESMMKKDGCAACHDVDKKLVGPGSHAQGIQAYREFVF